MKPENIKIKLSEPEKNQKPWLNAEVRALLKSRDAAFRAGEASALKVARKELMAGIAKAKATYARKIQGHFISNDPQSMWKGIKMHHGL